MATQAQQPPVESDTAAAATDYSAAFPSAEQTTTESTQTPVTQQTVADTQATPPAPQETQVQQQQQPQWYAELEQYGFKGVKDEEDARQRLIQAYREADYQRRVLAQQFENYRPLIGYGQEYLESQRRAQYEQQQQQQPQQPAAQDVGPWPQLPEIDPATVQRYRNEDGSWKFNTPPSLIEAAERFVDTSTQWQQGLLYKPRETLAPLIQHEAKAVVQQAIREALGMEPQELVEKVRQSDPNSDQAYVNNLLLTNKDILFDVNPHTGERDFQRLSPWGQRLLQTVDQLMGSAQQMPEATAYFWAAKMVQSEIASQQAAASQAQAQQVQPVAQPQQVAQQQQEVAAKQQAYLRRAAARSVPSRGGSVSPVPEKSPTERQNPSESFGRRAAALLAQEAAFQ